MKERKRHKFLFRQWGSNQLPPACEDLAWWLIFLANRLACRGQLVRSPLAEQKFVPFSLFRNLPFLNKVSNMRSQRVSHSDKRIKPMFRRIITFNCVRLMVVTSPMDKFFGFDNSFSFSNCLRSKSLLITYRIFSMAVFS